MIPKRLIWLAVCLLFHDLVVAQNLVPNPSFEAYNVLPCGAASPVEFKRGINHWSPASLGSPDIISTRMDDNCSTHPKIHTMINLQPKSGRTMVGFFTWSHDGFREYVQCKLKQELIPGREYELTLWVARRYDLGLASDGIGVYFSDSLLHFETTEALGLTPHHRFDRVVESHNLWVRLKGTVTAPAANSHMIIGNFGTNAETDTMLVKEGRKMDAYYYLDDISLELLPEPEPEIADPPQHPSLLYFASGSSDLPQNCGNMIDSIVGVLQNNPEWAVRITGHTDDTGNDDINQSISNQRAAAVYQRLREAGLAHRAIETIGKGYTQPVDRHHDEEHRWRNRRVEIELFVP